MKRVVAAALAVISAGLLSTGSAQADWRDSILGNRSSSQTTVAAPKAAPKQQSAQVKSSAASKAKSSGTSSSGSSSGGATLFGLASYYWQPQKVASGGWFNPNAMTAAHKTLPFGTKVRVTNKNNGQSVTVTINDRGPYIAGRIIDLSSAAAGVINMKGAGVVPVSVVVLGR